MTTEDQITQLRASLITERAYLIANTDGGNLIEPDMMCVWAAEKELISEGVI